MALSLDSNGNMSAQENESNDQETLYFAESTNFFLYYPNAAKSSIYGKILSVTVVIFQFMIYGGLIYGGLDSYSARERQVLSNESGCDDDTIDVNNLYCENTQSGNGAAIFGAVMSMLLVALWLLHDMITLVEAFKQSIFMSILLLCELIVAYLCAWIYMVLGMRVGVSEAIFGGIAVIFVHDLDEQVYKAVNLLIIKKRRSWLVLFLPIFVPITCILIATVMGVSGIVCQLVDC